MTAILFAAALAAIGQPAESPAAPATDESAVTSFPASFFAESQPATAYDMILRVPGFTFDGGDAEVRGLAGASGNVLIDGHRPANKQDLLVDVLKRIPANSVLRIELIRGGGAGVDMAGQAILANIVRRSETALRGQAEASLARYGDGRVPAAFKASVTRKSPNTLSELSLELARTVDDEKGRGPRTRTNPDGSPRQRALYDERDGFHTYALSAAHERDLAGGKLRLTAALKREQERADTDLDTSFPAAAHEDILELNTDDSAELGLDWQGVLGPALSLELIGLQRLGREAASEDSNDGATTEAVEERGTRGESVGRAILRWTPSGRLSLEGGGEGAYNFLDSKSALAVNGVPVALPAAKVRIAETRFEGFASATWKPAPAWSIEAGTRVETSHLVQSGDSSLEKRLTFLKPRLLVIWTPGPATQFRATLEREVGQLDFGDFVSSTSLTSNTVTAGNKDLEPARTWIAELTWDRRVLDSGSIVLTARHEWISYVVDRIGVIGPGFVYDARGNIGDGEKTRLSAALQLPLDRLGLTGGLIKAEVGYRWTSVTDPTTGVRRPISGEEPIDGEVHFTLDRPHLGLRSGVDVELGKTEREYRFDEVRRTHLGVRTSLFVEYRLAPGWTARAFAENITGRHAVRERSIYTGPRNVAALRYPERRDLASQPLIGALIRRTF